MYDFINFLLVDLFLFGISFICFVKIYFICPLKSSRAYTLRKATCFLSLRLSIFILILSYGGQKALNSSVVMTSVK